MTHKLLKYFEFSHLPPHLQVASIPFWETACKIAAFTVVDEAERTVALRKLLEAKDAAVRSMLP